MDEAMTLDQAEAEVRGLFKPYYPLVDLLVTGAKTPLSLMNEETALAVIFDLVDAKVQDGSVNNDKLVGIIAVAIIQLTKERGK